MLGVLQFAKQKANELEDYQNISLSGTDLEGRDEPAIKKRKLAKEVHVCHGKMIEKHKFLKEKIKGGGGRGASSCTELVFAYSKTYSKLAV